MIRISRLAMAVLLSVSVFACGSGDETPDCPPGTERCGEACVDLLRDAAACGACDRTCAEGEGCVDGACEPACEGGQRRCDGECTDPLRDPLHCGGCGITCAEGEACVDGACLAGCPGGLDCDGECVDVSRDEKNCGGCGKLCDQGEACVDGGCVCREGLQTCGDACVDVDEDANHCGACDVACEEGEICVEGSCVCGPERLACDGACVDSQSSDLHCGACDVACLDRPNSVGGSCVAGTCELVCEEGFADCDGDPDNGCEVDLRNDAGHCGSCFASCNTLFQVESALCIDSACHIESCAEGWDDCDLEASTGCEASLEDPEHCGACSLSCAGLPNNLASPACDAGTCELECSEGWADCDGNDRNGCEVDTQLHVEHCGACGNPCASGEICVFGSCLNPEWPQGPIPADTPDPSDYSVDGDIVSDAVTGLHWQAETPALTLSWADAQDQCAMLRLGGFTDWRVPTLLELVTIVDFSQQGPAIQEDFFPYTQSSPYWPTHGSTESEGNGWAVQFRYGEVNVPLPSRGEPVPQGYLRCVRGGKYFPGPRFVYDEDDPVLRDPRTELMWQRHPSESTMGWEDAQAYCEDSRTGGFSDWRLPGVKELMSIVDYRRLDPAIDERAFPETPAGDFWTSTPRIHLDQHAWFVGFRTGNATGKLMTSSSWVRCVRNQNSP